jgi:regulator of replication initiation timing
VGLTILRAIGIRGGLAILLALLAALCWFKWGHWKGKYDVLSGQATTVLIATREASDNPDLKWEDTARQIEELDASLTGWKNTAELQSGTIDAMGEETKRLQAENAELSAKVAALNKKRDALIAKLNNDALDPGDRADCWAQIREADEALNTLYKEGF